MSFLFLPSQKVVDKSNFTVAIEWRKAIHNGEKPSPLEEESTPQGQLKGIKEPRYLSSLKAPVEVDESQKVREALDSPIAITPQNVDQIYSASRVDEEERAENKASLSVAKLPIIKKKKRIASKPLPKYPWICRKRGQEGSVSLMVQTNEEGQVISVSLHKSSGYAALDQSALTAVKYWVFDDHASQKILSIAFHLKS